MKWRIAVTVILCAFLFMGSIFASAVHSVAAKSKVSNAQSMITIERDSLRVLYSYNSREKLPMASTTKIATAITVLEHIDDWEQTINVPKEAVGIEGSSVYLKENERVSIKELLYGLMLRSGNDCAMALALTVSDSVDEFCQLMNETAKKVGALETNFVNPHGLHNDNHYTTAYDLALISAYAMRNDYFSEIVKTKFINFPHDDENSGRSMQNKNKILNLIDGGNGIKTGFTKKAGRCLVAAAERNGMTLISVVLNCAPMFEDCCALLEMGFSEYNNDFVIPPFSPVCEVNVFYGEKKSVLVGTKGEKKFPLTEDERKRLEFVIKVEPNRRAPVEIDEFLGKIEIYLDNQLLFCENLYSINSVDYSFEKTLKDIFGKWN